MTATHRITVEVQLSPTLQDPQLSLASIVLTALYDAEVPVLRVETEQVQP